MLASRYYYNESIKKIVAVFGSLFNDITIAKRVGNNTEGFSRVPLSYAPRQKFLERLAASEGGDTPNGPVAIRLPRMSFEITSFTPDPAAKLNRLNQTYQTIQGNDDEKALVYQSAPYTMGMALNIYTRQNDDALQILEQILPYFNPEYTVTVKELEGPESLTDLPIILNSISLNDDYEGDFTASRRQIIYTLEFTLKVKFSGLIRTETPKIIKFVSANLYSNLQNLSPDTAVNLSLGDPENDTPEAFTVITTFGFADDDDHDE